MRKIITLLLSSISFSTLQGAAFSGSEESAYRLPNPDSINYHQVMQTKGASCPYLITKPVLKELTHSFLNREKDKDVLFRFRNSTKNDSSTVYRARVKPPFAASATEIKSLQTDLSHRGFVIGVLTAKQDGNLATGPKTLITKTNALCSYKLVKFSKGEDYKRMLTFNPNRTSITHGEFDEMFSEPSLKKNGAERFWIADPKHNKAPRTLTLRVFKVNDAEKAAIKKRYLTDKKSKRPSWMRVIPKPVLATAEVPHE